MMRLLLLLALFLSFPVHAAKGGKASLGASSDSGHGSPGAGGGGATSSTGSLRNYRDPRNAPPLADKRNVSEQDCTKPIDPQAGNLRCK